MVKDVFRHVNLTHQLLFKTKVLERGPTRGKWLIHGTKYGKGNQLQSLELPRRKSLRIQIWYKGVRWQRVQCNILKHSPVAETSQEVSN